MRKLLLILLILSFVLVMKAVVFAEIDLIYQYDSKESTKYKEALITQIDLGAQEWEHKYDYAGNLIGKTFSRREYDEKGNLIKRIEYLMEILPYQKDCFN